MYSLLILVAAQAATPVPRPLTPNENRDIGCVALLGLLADEQRRGVEDTSFPDVTATGKTYAGIVGSRISAESGLPREIVAQAILTAAADARSRADATLQGKTAVRNQLKLCLPLMQAELAAAAATSQPLPKPVKSQ